MAEWIKLWYIYTMEYYLAIKRNTFELVLMRWMNLEPIIQSEVSQKEKDKYCILTHIYQEDPLEEEMAAQSGILARRIPWMEEPGRNAVARQRINYSHWGRKELATT